MTREQLRKRLAGFEELQAFELEERRAATPAMRMRQLDAIWSLAAELGVKQTESHFDPSVSDQWSKLRRAIYERSRLRAK
jgi:hypothetical protein